MRKFSLCAWCDDMIAAGAGAAVSASVSHGICKSCLDEKLAALADPRRRNKRTLLGHA